MNSTINPMRTAVFPPNSQFFAAVNAVMMSFSSAEGWGGLGETGGLLGGTLGGTGALGVSATFIGSAAFGGTPTAVGVGAGVGAGVGTDADVGAGAIPSVGACAGTDPRIGEYGALEEVTGTWGSCCLGVWSGFGIWDFLGNSPCNSPCNFRIFSSCPLIRIQRNPMQPSINQAQRLASDRERAREIIIKTIINAITLTPSILKESLFYTAQTLSRLILSVGKLNQKRSKETLERLFSPCILSRFFVILRLRAK